MEWPEIKQHAHRLLEKKQLSGLYLERLDEEIYEIEKQGLNDYWVEHITKKTQWPDNPSGLVLPWLMGLTSVDPIIGVPRIMIEAPDGSEIEAIVVQLDDDREICVSPETLVLTNVGYVKASNLKIDHIIGS